MGSNQKYEYDESYDPVLDQIIEGRKRRSNPIPHHIAIILGEAHDLFLEGDYKQAVDKLLEVIRQVPNVVDPYHTLGVIYEEMKNLHKAAEFYMIAAYITYKDVALWKRLAEIYAELNSYEKAIYCYSKVIRLDPNDLESIFHRTTLYGLLNDKKKEIEGYILLNKKNSNELEWYKELGRLYHETGQKEKAIEILEAGFETMKDYTGESEYELYYKLELINMLTELYIGESLYEKALEILSWAEKFKDIESMPLELTVNKGICKSYLGLKEEGEMYLDKVQEYDIENYSEIYYSVAETYFAISNFEKALFYYYKLMEVETYNKTGLWLKIAKSHVNLSNYEEAIQYYESVFNEIPDSINTCISLSELYLKIGNIDSSINVLHIFKMKNSHGQEGIFPRIEAQEALVYYEISNYDMFLKVSLNLLLDPNIVFCREKKKIVGPSFLNDDILPVLSVGNKSNVTSIDELEKSTTEENKTKQIKKENIIDIIGKDIYLNLLINSLKTLLYKERYEEATNLFKISYVFLLNVDSFRLEKETKNYLKYLGVKCAFKSGDYDIADQFLRSLCNQYPENIKLWNFLNDVTNKTGSFHLSSRYIQRMVAKHPNSVPLRILNGHSHFIVSTYRLALAEYFVTYNIRPTLPLINLCIGISYLCLSMSRRTPDRHMTVIKAFSFISKYYKLSKKSQEATYNLARAFHQLNLTNFAIPLYEKVLKNDWEKVTMHDNSGKHVGHLKYEAAYNLANIYRTTGANYKAIEILKKYVVI